MSEAMKDSRAKWTVHTKIEKFNTEEAFAKGEADEILSLPGNCLLNMGVNSLWQLVAGYFNDGSATYGSTDPKFPKSFGPNSYIGVGDSNIPAVASQEGLQASAHKVYMKMDQGYPYAGANQKIVFRSTFLPGIACFDWLEWTVANGNGNFPTKQAFDDYCFRTTQIGDEPIPDPVPTIGATGATAPDGTPVSLETGVGEEGVINLNRKQENMGKKYSSATWIVTVELSLS